MSNNKKIKRGKNKKKNSFLEFSRFTKKVFSNKKAILFTMAVLIGVPLAASLFLIEFSKLGGFEVVQLRPLGKVQLNILTVMNRAQTAKFFVDKTGEYAADQAIYNLASGQVPFNCGKHRGLAVWYSKDKKKDCLVKPSKAIDVFRRELSKEVTESVRRYVEDDLLLAGYTYLISKTGEDRIHIAAKATQKTEIPFNQQKFNKQGMVLSADDLIFPLDSKNKPGLGRITSCFGYRVFEQQGKHHEGFHKGVDIAGSPVDDIFAMADGIILKPSRKNCPDNLPYNGAIIQKTDSGLQIQYLHTSVQYVTPGQRVKQGQVIGKVGGRSKCPPERPVPTHLHLDIIDNAGVAKSHELVEKLRKQGVSAAYTRWNLNYIDPLLEMDAYSLFGKAGIHFGRTCSPNYQYNLWPYKDKGDKIKIGSPPPDYVPIYDKLVKKHTKYVIG